MLISAVFILSILAGQLIKFPLFGIQGPTLLDLLVFLISVIGSFRLNFKLKEPNLVIKTGLLFIFVATLSLIFTPLHLNIDEYAVSFSYIVRFSLFLFTGWVMYSGSFQHFRKQISNTLLLAGVGISVLGLLQFIFFPNLEFLENFGWDPHYFRTVSTFLDPNFAGAFFVLTLLLLINQKATKLNIVFFVLTYLALLTTFSRSSYLMFLTSGLVYTLFRKSKTLVISTVVFFLGLLLGFQVYSKLIAQPRGINRIQSAAFRLETWQQGLFLFQKSPFLGVGFNSYKYAIREYHLAAAEFLDSRGATTNDSSFLYILSTTGVIGFIVYSLFVISILRYGIKYDKILAAAIAGLIPHSFFANSFFYPFILIWIMLKVSDIRN